MGSGMTGIPIVITTTPLVSSSMYILWVSTSLFRTSRVLHN